MSRLVDERASADGAWDVVFASDMLNLAEFRGLVRPSLRNLPTVLYFHENQLTYPSRIQDDRDLHLAYTNFTSAVAADAIWFNSEFHRREFLEQYGQWLQQMPDHPHGDALKSVERRASVRHPGIEPVGVANRERNPEPVLIWPARWEHDKNPELLAIAVQTLAEKNVPFRLRLLGKVFQTRPPALESLGERIGGRLIAAPPPESRDDYLRELQRGDIVISTADHEFFGLAVLEALSAGCYPALPNRLAYPELIEHLAPGHSEAYLYDGTRRGLVERLTLLIQRTAADQLWQNGSDLAAQVDEQFGWEVRAQELDEALKIIAY
jgi:glycosyltransferase involved in cell wall biosynthesis